MEREIRQGWPEKWFERVVSKWVGPFEREQPPRPAAIHAIGEARGDDEPDGDDSDGGLTEARAQADAGMGISTVELEERLGPR